MTSLQNDPARPSRAFWRGRLAKFAGALVLATTLALAGCASTSGSATATATPSLSASATTTETATSTTAGTTAETISATTAAATAFLATLSEEQREQVLYAYDDETKTTSWSNFPVTFVQRAGVNLNDLTAEQQAAALAVL